MALSCSIRQAHSISRETNSATMPRWPKRSTSLAGASLSRRVRKDRSNGPRPRLISAMRSGRLGERESGTARLEEAVDAYREALKVRTRERVPLHWAGNQDNLGIALETSRRAGKRDGAAQGGRRRLSRGPCRC